MSADSPVHPFTPHVDPPLLGAVCWKTKKKDKGQGEREGKIKGRESEK